jgi:hypothetical protein
MGRTFLDAPAFEFGSLGFMPSLAVCVMFFFILCFFEGLFLI